MYLLLQLVLLQQLPSNVAFAAADSGADAAATAAAADRGEVLRLRGVKACAAVDGDSSSSTCCSSACCAAAGASVEGSSGSSSSSFLLSVHAVAYKA